MPASVEVADLIQAGMLGLLEAAANYTADRGASFETYAGIRIRGAMLDALRKLDWAPRSVHRKARAAAAAVREIEAEFGREARDTEIAQKMGVSLHEYHKIAHDAASCRIASLDDSNGDDESAGSRTTARIRSRMRRTRVFAPRSPLRSRSCPSASGS
jgi:RNA polymerase sigma factor for flagellar operon FliA